VRIRRRVRLPDRSTLASAVPSAMVPPIEEGLVTQSHHHTLVRIAAIGALILALGLAGCGRKSGLDPPPAAAIGDQALAPGGQEPGIGPDGKPIAPQGAKRSTLLDWLID
jgi:hypothetical protein